MPRRLPSYSRYSRYNDRISGGGSPYLIRGLIVAVAILAAIAAIGLNVYSASHTESLTCTVTGKDRTQKSGGSKSEMRVYTSDCGTLKIADSLLDTRWDSADLYGSLKENSRYEMTTRGVRLPFFSMFPNIITAKEVATP